MSQELWLLCYTVEDGKFCEDFYLRKCPIWKAHDQCETVDKEGVWEYRLVKEVCRKSCGVCTPQYLSISIDNNNDNNNNNNHKDDVVGEEVKVTKQVVDTRVLLSPLVPPEVVVVVVVQSLSDLEKQQLKSDG